MSKNCKKTIDNVEKQEKTVKISRNSPKLRKTIN